MTVITAPSTVVTHHVRNTLIFLVLLLGACVGLYEGAGMLMHRLNAPHTTVSYATADAVNKMLAGAWHTPATAGDFRATADISHGNVVSVVKIVP